MSRRGSDEIVKLLTAVQQPLTRYVRTLVPNRADADEVLQEANLHVWRHADEFEPGTNFAAWACRIAYFQVLTFRKRQSRNRLQFCDALVEQLAQGGEPSLLQAGSDAEALDRCMAKLNQRDRQLMEMRYEPGATVEGVAQQVGRSKKAVYTALGRIRSWLLECMRQTAAESRSP
jgi:RNA polymerase sigma-70 factor, ECF subfamily